MKIISIAIVRGLAFAGLAFLSVVSHGQQAYPSKPIRFIVPYSGGAIDTLARLLSPKLQETLRQPIIVEPRPGANAIIGTDFVAKSAADGYTFLMVLTTHVISPNLIVTPYDPIKDFTPVATLAAAELGLAVNPAVPAKTLQELIALGKASPGKLNYATTQVGGNQHLAGELFGILTGAKFTAVPYKGAGDALNAVLGGHAEMYLGNLATLIPVMRSEKLRGIAASGESRPAAMPQLPTFTESGVPNFDVRLWYGLLAPAGTPREIVEKMSGLIAVILTSADFKEALAKQGMEALVMKPNQFGALMHADFLRYEKVIKTANIKVEN